MLAQKYPSIPYLIYVWNIKNGMKRLGWTSFIVSSTMLALTVQILIGNSVMAQTPNTSLVQNNESIKIVDPKNHTISIIDPKTDQVIRVEKFTGNATSNESLITENIKTNEIFTLGKPTINGTLTPNTENVTTSVNLTNKFESFKGK